MKIPDSINKESEESYFELDEALIDNKRLLKEKDDSDEEDF